ncbi:MAG: Methicillin resistance regulatory protein MecI [Verrucomicrobia subdivision 3 bacterium]|nr:Methicillin resistance regulatory protein MecI [Limisphaerales bacterium]MCS1414262.1 Methicillin resistance regulatory protein MecI [Limisphaerales bacterium]
MGSHEGRLQQASTTANQVCEFLLLHFDWKPRTLQTLLTRLRKRVFSPTKKRDGNLFTHHSTPNPSARTRTAGPSTTVPSTEEIAELKAILNRKKRS